MENYDFFKLNNGIKGVHYRTQSSPVGHFGITIKAGSRDELENEWGMAHFIEHCIFKGTTNRKPFHILSRLDAVGGEINAYTTKEETCIYGSFLIEYFDRAIELIADILFNSTFPEVEINKEKDVIIDEINSYLDSPSEQIFDDFEELIFKNHAIGRNILGSKKSLKKFTAQSIKNFISRNYKAENIVFSSVGNIDAKKLEKMVFKHLEKPLPKGELNERIAYRSYQPQQETLAKETYQTHCLIGRDAYSMHHTKRRSFVLLNNILGGMGLNSRLNLNIREKYGVTYTIDSNYSAYSDTGVFNIYFSSEKKAYERIIKLVHKELDKLKTKKLGVNQLHQAKQQLKGHIALAQENKANLMLSLGKSYLYFDKIDTNEQIFKTIDTITAEEIIDIANEMFDTNQLTTLIYT